jgi:hypothetical protein
MLRRTRKDRMPLRRREWQEQLTHISRISSYKSDATGDLAYQTEQSKTPAQLGTIPYSGEVISTYDSRPINALDFTSTAYPQFVIPAIPPAPVVLQSNYTVPGGYIGVLRGYRYEMDPIVPINYGQLLLDIFVDGVAQLGYQGLMHGQILAAFVPCFILISDGGTVTFQWRAPTGIGSNPGDVRHLIVEFYGNLLLSTGAPLTLEVANKEIGLPVKAQMASNPELSGLAQLQEPGAAYRSMTRHRARYGQRYPK